MTTKLEAIVDLLAGREGEPRFLDELADPASEASRFLEATRARSRALLEEPVPLQSTRPAGSKRRWPLVLLAATVLLAAGAGGFILVYARLRSLEAALSRGQAESAASTARLESLLARLEENRPAPGSIVPIEEVLGRIENRLAQLDQRVEATNLKPEAPKADPAVASVRDELAALRRERASADKATARQSEEIQASLHDVARLLKLLLGRSPTTVPPEDPPLFPPARPAVGADPRPRP